MTANRHRFTPDLLLHFTTRYRGNPGTARGAPRSLTPTPTPDLPWRAACA